MTDRLKIRIIKGQIFRVYFEYMAGLKAAPEKGRTLSAVVIASNAEEAIRKCKMAFPKEIVHSLHSDRMFEGPSRIEEIVY